MDKEKMQMLIKTVAASTMAEGMRALAEDPDGVLDDLDRDTILRQAALVEGFDATAAKAVEMINAVFAAAGTKLGEKTVVTLTIGEVAMSQVLTITPLEEADA